MVDFRDSGEAQRWFEAQPREVAVAMAARAALRVLPLLAPRRGQPAARFRSTVILTCFRATATPWVAAKHPTHGVELHAAADAAAYAAAYAAAHAAATAAGAAAAAYAAAATAAGATTAAAAYAAAATAAASYTAADADAAFIEGGADGEQRRLAADLAGRALWPESQPVWAAQAWRDMKRRLLAAGEDWDVWTAWYDAVLAGHGPSDDAVALAYVTLPEDLWKAGPKAANAEIKRRIEEIIKQKEPPAEPIPPQGVGPQFSLGPSGK